jgi:hypothetical protein
MGGISRTAGYGFVRELATGMHMDFDAGDRLVTKNLLCRYAAIPGLRQIDSGIRYDYLKENRFLSLAINAKHPSPGPKEGSEEGCC